MPPAAAVRRRTLWDLIAGPEGRIWYETQRPQDRPLTPAGASGATPVRRTYIDRSQLTDRALALLDTPLPDGVSGERAARYRDAITAKLPTLTKAHEAIAASRTAAATREAAIQPVRARSDPLAQFSEGVSEALPSVPERWLPQPGTALDLLSARRRSLDLPETNIADRIARTVGRVVGFAGPAALTGGASAAAAAGLRAPAAVQTVARYALGPGLVAGAQEGTAKQRLARAVTSAAAGVATGVVGDVVAARVIAREVARAGPGARRAIIEAAREREAAMLAGGASPQVARAAAISQAREMAVGAAQNVARAHGSLRGAAHSTAGAALFGAAQPWAENYWRRKAGEDLPPITLRDMAEGAGGLAAFDLLTRGAAAAGARARRGMAAGGAEVPRGMPALLPGESAPPAAPPAAVPPSPVPGAPPPPGVLPLAPGPTLAGRGPAIVGRYARAMRGPANVLFGGKPQLDIFHERLQANLAATGKPIDQLQEGEVGKAAAHAARFAVKAEAIRAALIVDPPAGRGPEAVVATQRTDQKLVGKELTVTAPELGLMPVQVRVVKTFWYPWDRQAGFRLLVEDPATGDLAPLVYASPEAFSQAIPGPPAAPQLGTPAMTERGPAGTLPGIIGEAGAAPSGARPVEGLPSPQQPPAPATPSAPTREPASTETTDADIDAAMAHPDFAPEWKRLQREGASNEEIADLLEKSLRAVKGEGFKSLMAVTKGGRVYAGFDPSIIRKVASKMYEGSLTRTVTKEFVQNAVDAVREMGSGGRVSVDVNTERRTFEIEDNGVGMTPEVVQRELVDVGASFKPGAVSTGGFGIAKAVLFSNADEILIKTVASVRGQKIETVLQGSGQDWMEPERGMRVDSHPVGAGTPTGTHVFVKIAEKHADGTPINLASWEAAQFATEFRTYARTGANVSFRVNGREQVEKTKGREQYEPLGRIEHGNFSADVYATPESEFAQHVGYQVLNYGIPQFSGGHYMFGGKAQARTHYLFDVRSKVGAESAAYPFTTSREALSGEAQTAITKWIAEHLKATTRKQSDVYKEALERTHRMPSGFMFLDTSAQLDPEYVRSLAGPEMDRLAVLSSDYLTALAEAMKGRSSEFVEGKAWEFGGIAVDKETLGFNLSASLLYGEEGKPNLIFLSPFNSLYESMKAQTNGYIPNTMDGLADDLSRSIVATATHELAHQLERNESAFAGPLTRVQGWAMGYDDRAREALRKELTANGHRSLNRLIENFRTLQGKWAHVTKDLFHDARAGLAGEGSAERGEGHPAPREGGGIQREVAVQEGGRGEAAVVAARAALQRREAVAQRVREKFAIPTRAGAAEAAGQGSLFGAAPPAEKPAQAPERPTPPAGAPRVPASATGGGESAQGVAPERGAEGAPAGVPSTSTGKWTRGETDVQTLDFHAPFQNRSIEEMGGFTDPEYLQSLLRGQGGFSMEHLEREPIMFWTDTKGEIGPAGKRYAISHHRTALAREDWVKEGERFISKGPMRRTVPTLEYHGTYAEALEVSKDVNRQTRPNTYVEDVSRAKDLKKSGKDIQAIADAMKVSKGRAQEMLDFGNLAPNVQASLGDVEGRPWGAALGRATGAHPKYYVPDVQQAWLTRITTGYFANVEHMKTMLKARAVVLDEWPQERLFDMPTDDQLMRAYGRAAKRLGDRRALAKRIRQYEAMVEDKGPEGAALARAAMAHLELARPRLAMYEKLAKDYALEKIVGRLTAAHARGLSLDAEAEKIGKEIDRVLGEPGPEDWGKKNPLVLPPMVLGLGGLQADQIQNAVAAIARGLKRAGRRVTELRLAWQGQTVHREPAFPTEPDYWHLYATYRWLGGALALGDAVLPVDFTLTRDIPGVGARGDKINLRERWRNIEPLVNADVRRSNEMLHLIVGDEGMRLLEPWTETDRLFADALDGKKGALEALPPVLRRALPMVRDFWHAELTRVQEAQAARGKPVPGRIAEYMPHILDALMPETLHRDIEEIEGRTIRDTELQDRKNRFYLQREGYQPQVMSFTDAWRRWHAAAWMKLHIDPVIQLTAEWLRSPAGGRHPENQRRAGRIRNWVQAHWMKREGGLERQINEGLRTLAFAQSAGAIQHITPEEAAEWVGQKAVLDGGERAGGPLKFFVAVLKGKHVEFSDPKAWTKIGEASGMDIYGGASGTAFGMPKLRAAPERLHLMMTENPVWFTNARRRFRGQWFSKPERTRRMLERRQSLLKLERDPLNASMAWWSRRTTWAVMGYKVSTAFVNLLWTVPASIMRYGWLATARAAATSTEIGIRKSLRATITIGERTGMLTPQQASHYRKHIGLLAEEVALDALSLRQGEAFFLAKLADDLAAGHGELERAFLKLMRPMGLQSMTEALSRGFDLHAAWFHGLSQGYSPGRVAKLYENSVAGRMRAMDDMLKELVGNDQSLMAEIQRSGQFTQYNYGPMGQPIYMANPIGRTFGQLSTFLVNNLLKQVLRPIEAAVRVPFSRGDDAREHRRAAIEGVRWLLVSGLLLWLAHRTKKNWAVAGVPSHAILLLKGMRVLFPDEKTYREWVERALAGETTPIFGITRPGHARGQAWASPTGALVYGWKAGPRESLLEAIRMAAFPGLSEWRSLVSERPNVFGPGRPLQWFAELLDVKAFYRMTPEQIREHQTRLMDPTERQTLKINPPREQQHRKRKPVRAY